MSKSVNLLFVCGMICSGKTFYAKVLANATNGKMLEVGDYVRSLKQTENRKELQDTLHFDKLIIERINQEITEILRSESERDSVDLIVCGTRQLSIIKAFPQATILWIECPFEVRKQRYYSRQREGDQNMSFEEAEQRDIQLGILEVKKYISR